MGCFMAEIYGCFYCDHHLHAAERIELKAPRLRFCYSSEAEQGKSYGPMDRGGSPMFVIFRNESGRIIVGLESPALAPVGAAVACFYTTR